MSIGIGVTIDGLERAGAAIGRLAEFHQAELLTGLGSMGESQTRVRIESEKSSPDGVPWAPNREGTSILYRSGDHIHNMLAQEVSGDVVRWGSSWQFAHIHQNGAVIVPKRGRTLSFMSGGARRHAKKVTIPARPFVGVSARNLADMDRLVTDFLGRTLR